MQFQKAVYLKFLSTPEMCLESTLQAPFQTYAEDCS